MWIEYSIQFYQIEYIDLFSIQGINSDKYWINKLYNELKTVRGPFSEWHYSYIVTRCSIPPNTIIPLLIKVQNYHYYLIRMHTIHTS